MSRVRFSNGVSHVADANGDTPQEVGGPPGSLRSGLVFVLIFLALHGLWDQARDTAVERLWIETATVKSAVALLNLISPEVQAVAQGSRIKAPGGGINVLNGCEGTDILFLLTAAFLAFRMPWRKRLAGLGLGVVLVQLLNQMRILALFHAYRDDRELFDLLHTVVAPLVLLAVAAAYFHAWTYRAGPAETA